MATQVLGSGSSSNGRESCDWQVDYDTTGHTVGHTCTGQASFLQLTVTIVSTGQTFTKDITGDLGAGRVVDFSGVQQKDLPVVTKGQPYPYLLGSVWVP